LLWSKSNQIQVFWGMTFKYFNVNQLFDLFWCEQKYKKFSRAQLLQKKGVTSLKDGAIVIWPADFRLKLGPCRGSPMPCASKVRLIGKLWRIFLRIFMNF
jgi:hypothetical protein